MTEYYYPRYGIQDPNMAMESEDTGTSPILRSEERRVGKEC